MSWRGGRGRGGNPEMLRNLIIYFAITEGNPIFSCVFNTICNGLMTLFHKFGVLFLVQEKVLDIFWAGKGLYQYVKITTSSKRPVVKRVW